MRDMPTMGEALDAIKTRYNAVFNAHGDLISQNKKLHGLLCKAVCELEDYKRWLAREKLPAPARKVRGLIAAIDLALSAGAHDK